MSVGSSTSIRFDGLATGLDTTAIIDAILGVEALPLLGIQGRQADLEIEQELYRDLNTRLQALEEAVQAVDNQNSLLSGATLDEEFLEFSVSSTDESIITAEANGSASPGPIDVRVDTLAQVGRQVSDGFASPSTIIATEGQTFQIDYGGAATIDLTIGAGGATLEDLRDLINQDANNVSGVRAEILDDGATSRLVISGLATGAANDITVTTDIDGPGGGGSPFIDAALTQVAGDAQINVLGVNVTRPSNTMTDVIPGVTLRLNGVHDPLVPTARTTLNVERDHDEIEAKLQAIVDAYNSVREFSIEQSAYDEETESAGLLSGDLTLRSIERDLQAVLAGAFTIPGNPFNSLSSIGLVFESDGTTSDGKLTLDSEKLTAALDEDALAVRQLLAGDGVTDGAATALARVVDSIVRSGDGVLAIREDGLEDQIRSYDATIERMELRLEAREQLLIQQYTLLETLVSSLQSDSSFLTALLTPVTDT